jgi:cell division protein FtsW
MKLFQKFGHGADTTLIIVVCILLFAGFLFLSSASSDVGKLKFDDSYHFIKDQALKGLLPGIAGFLLGYFTYYRRWKRISFFLLAANILLLVLVFVPGVGYAAKGSHRWIGFGSFSFQPSELLKITFILYLANLLSSSLLKRSKNTWQTYFLFVGISVVIGGLIFAQPATTMAVIVLGAGVVVYFLNGATFKQVLVSGLVAAVAIGALIAATPYRFLRVLPFWNDIAEKVAPTLVIQDEKGRAPDSFHEEQSLNAIGTGGISGVGFGKSTTKYSLLPEPMGDSIFSVIAEETGFIGSSIVILLYILLFWRMTDIMQRCHDDFARLTVLGFASVISIQTIIHIAANTGLFPYTGVPLPFISYGGTALAVMLTMMGITANISRHTSRVKTL